MKRILRKIAPPRTRDARIAYGRRRVAGKLAIALLLIGGVTAAPRISVAQTAATGKPVTIAALGDSLTHGYGLRPEQAFPMKLEAWLNDRGADARVLNAGVSGDTTAGGRARLDWTLSDGVDAVIVELGANDLLRGIDPASSRANLAAILAALQARGVPALLVGIPAPGNFGPDYKRAFDGMFAELAAQYDALLYENFMAGLGAGGDLSAAQGLMQADGIHPNADGVTRIVAHMGPVVETLVARARDGG